MKLRRLIKFCMCDVCLFVEEANHEFKDLYVGSCCFVPQEYLDRKIYAVLPSRRYTKLYLEIELKNNK